jgi:16S rRNA (guanine966-N2)-methyltransferase
MYAASGENVCLECFQSTCDFNHPSSMPIKRKGHPAHFGPDDAADDAPKPKRGPLKKIGPKPLRIIGGELRRRTITYNGDRVTRPMKDNVRENVFNILGSAICGAVAYDLFAGTGILAIESISRGAEKAIAIDLLRSCIRSIRDGAESLGVTDKIEVLTGDTFRIAPTRFKFAEGERRVVFCCPPYAFWLTDTERLNGLLSQSFAGASKGSIIIAETDNKFPTDRLLPADWDVRQYGNTRICVAEVV